MTGTLYIVATPIGNLEDITLRAIEILFDVDTILAEDTRVTRKLLSKLMADGRQLKANLLTYHQQSKDERKQEILLKLLTGNNIALVTDAGTPGISDPGNELIEYLLASEPTIKIVPIPGPSSVTALLSVSGIRADKYVFIGYFPRKKKTKLFKIISEIEMPVVFFESPYRILKTLEEVVNRLGGDKKIVVGQELTKMFEKLRRGSTSEVLAELKEEASELKRVKGEITCILVP
jgi:16S rRNA (cytidine1402-2'-O)-methyltransferase